MERPADEISYTPSQLRAYLEHIDLCSDASDFPEPSIPWLEKLIRHHISSIPFENLAMHYSKTHLLDLDPVNLYTKVIKRGFGGGCTELNRMFGLLMKGLGFEVTMHGARVHAAAGGGEGDWYFGWTHMVNLVHLNGNNYLVDVAFGGLGPVKPLLLEPNSIASGVGNQQYRLSKEVVKSQGQAEGLWIYQQRTRHV
ncbi:N-terminal acetyltransferase [Xylographa bjoerkii]|nr:N-terminal acetyltransferase [Xylographa bjoerkii]